MSLLSQLLPTVFGPARSPRDVLKALGVYKKGEQNYLSIKDAEKGGEEGPDVVFLNSQPLAFIPAQSSIFAPSTAF